MNDHRHRSIDHRSCITDQRNSPILDQRSSMMYPLGWWVHHRPSITDQQSSTTIYRRSPTQTTDQHHRLIYSRSPTIIVGLGESIVGDHHRSVYHGSPTIDHRWSSIIGHHHSLDSTCRTVWRTKQTTMYSLFASSDPPPSIAPVGWRNLVRARINFPIMERRRAWKSHRQVSMPSQHEISARPSDDRNCAPCAIGPPRTHRTIARHTF